MAAYLTPPAARQAAFRDALAAFDDRKEAIGLLSREDHREAHRASLALYEADCAAAYAVYDCAIAAQARAAIAYDQAFYEHQHGTLDGLSAWRSEDVETARAEAREREAA